MKILLLLSFNFTFYILSAQNYIADYHQPSILGHKSMLEGTYVKAIEHLEKCIAQQKTWAKEHYSLGICYFFTNRIDEGINSIYVSYKKGHTPRAIMQDSAVLCNYMPIPEFLSFRDSCLSILSLRDSLSKVKYRDEGNAAEQLFQHRWATKVYMDSIRKTMDSLDFEVKKVEFSDLYSDALYKKTISFIDNCGWEGIERQIEPQNLAYICIGLQEKYLEELSILSLEEVKNGNIPPGYYATLYDFLEKRYTGKTKYSQIKNPNSEIIDSEKFILENDCFQIGIGNTEVLYLMYREYKY